MTESGHTAGVWTPLEEHKARYACRFHPVDWWHEVGCSHREWTVAELREALDCAKQSNGYLAHCAGLAASAPALLASNKALAEALERIARYVHASNSPESEPFESCGSWFCVDARAALAGVPK